MNNNNTSKNLQSIRNQIDLLKERLDGIGKTLDFQEEVLDMLYENSKSLIQDALFTEKNYSVDEIMKNAFKTKQIPKILYLNKYQ